MKLTTAGEIQSKLKAGLQIVGDDSNGNLQFMGSVKQWNQAKQNHLDPVETDYRDFTSGYDAITPDKL